MKNNSDPLSLPPGKKNNGVYKTGSRKFKQAQKLVLVRVQCSEKFNRVETKLVWSKQ